LLFYFIHFTSDPFFFLLSNTTAFLWARKFNADISKWDVSSVKTLKQSKSCLEISDSGGPLLFYFIHFTSYTFFFLHPTHNLTTAFDGAEAFNADISNWVVSGVTTLFQSKSFLANC